jgi:hypothetical protein
MSRSCRRAWRCRASALSPMLAVLDVIGAHCDSHWLPAASPMHIARSTISGHCRPLTSRPRTRPHFNTCNVVAPPICYAAQRCHPRRQGKLRTFHCIASSGAYQCPRANGLVSMAGASFSRYRTAPSAALDGSFSAIGLVSNMPLFDARNQRVRFSAECIAAETTRKLRYAGAHLHYVRAHATSFVRSRYSCLFKHFYVCREWPFSVWIGEQT